MLTAILCTERLEDIQFIDRPDIELPSTSEDDGGVTTSESVSMPFKYVKGDDGRPVMPKVSNIDATPSFVTSMV